MSTRQQQKRASRDRILLAASKRLRADGLGGPAIAAVMQEAGLTHGAFSAHFKNKDELTLEAFQFALNQNQPRWLRHKSQSFADRLTRMGADYLKQKHADEPWAGCPIAALASEVASNGSEEFRQLYEAAVSLYPLYLTARSPCPERSAYCVRDQPLAVLLTRAGSVRCDSYPQ